MTICIDNRAGSLNLIPILKARGVPVESTRLEYGDVSFIGWGRDGSPITTGIEVKVLSDALTSMQDSRFTGHQLPGMKREYDLTWLCVIGEYRANFRTGELEEYAEGRGGGHYWRSASYGRKRPILWREFQARMITLQIKAGLEIQVCRDYNEAALWISTLYAWWQKGWDDHDSHLTIYDALDDVRKGLFDRALLVRPTITQLVAGQLPGVGRLKSIAVASRFKSVEAMVEATETEWMSIPGIGKELARRLVRVLKGGKAA